MKRPSSIAVALLVLTGCWSHYGIAVELTTVPGVTGSDVERAKAIVQEIAADWGMERSDGIDIPSTDSDLLVFYSGPYSPERERLAHPAGGMRLSLWIAKDRSNLSVWIVDWGDVGVSERLRQIRDQTWAALENAFPGYALEVEEQRLGVLSP